MSAVPPGLQLTFDLGTRDVARIDGFEPGGNAAVLERLRTVTTGEPGHIYLHGGEGCGKTHLLLAVCAQAQSAGWSVVYAPLGDLVSRAASVLEGLGDRQLLCLDDVDAVADNDAWRRALFNLWNAVDANGGRCLCAAGTPLYALHTGLADLDSRLRAALALRLQPLDDEGRIRAVQRLASHRGFEVSGDVARFLVLRLPRDMHSLARAVEVLDRRSLELQRRVTVPFARQCLRDMVAPASGTVGVMPAARSS